MVEQNLKMPDAEPALQGLNSLQRTEQEKRRHFYDIIDETKKVEFINGDIIFHPPDSLQENNATGSLCNLLRTYVLKNDLGLVGVERIMISLTRNDYEPDICFFGKEKAKDFTANQMYFPAPDLAVEILSDLTEKADRETKFKDYAAHGVGEYWIINAEKEVIEQYFLMDEKFELLLKSNSGEISSVVLPDFKIPVRAVFDGKINIETLSKIVA